MKIIKIKISKLVIDKEQPRKNLESLKDLAKSIDVKGQLTPIIIDKSNKIYDGHRRYFALMNYGNIKYLDAVVMDDSKISGKFLKKAYPFAVNIERHGFKPFEMAESIAHIYWNYFIEDYKPKSRNDNGYKTFAQYMGVGITIVNDILSTYQSAKKSKVLSQALKKKDIAFSTLKVIAKYPVDAQKHYIELIRKEQDKPQVDRTHLRDMIRDERSRDILQAKKELNRTYIGRIKSNSKDLNSLLNTAVIKLANREQINQIDNCLYPIIKFYKQLKK